MTLPAGIRAARAADDPDLVRIDDVTWSTAVSPAPAPPPGRTFFDDHRRPADVLVAEVNGAVAGYVSLGPGFGIPAHARVLDLNGLAVDPAMARRGVGRALVEAAVVEATRRGSRKLGLRVLWSNPGARRLYASCGFVVEGVLRAEFRIGSDYVDDVLMARMLVQSAQLR